MRTHTMLAAFRGAMVLLLIGASFQGPSWGIAQELIPNVVLAIHGGAAPSREEFIAEQEQQIRATMAEALTLGKKRLDEGGASLDAVETAIRVLEDSPLFNAGRGAVFTAEGRNELDASIMEGKSRRAGAVGGVTTVKNPISAARAVMEKSKHVLITGRGAEIFASKQGLEIVDPSYFWTEQRWKEIESVWKKEANDRKRSEVSPEVSMSHGTVGAVARDKSGNLAAGTSTGGMNNKMGGRLGDSPIIGAGTYADNETGAISCTGHGEFFIRFSVAHEILSQVRYKKVNIAEAAHDVLGRQLNEAGGKGAVIALDSQGGFASAYNEHGLFRGYITADGEVVIRLYDE